MSQSQPSTNQLVTIVGGGLAGTEAAWQLASRGVAVRLLEMRPLRMPPAHHTEFLAELVCSNSLKGTDPCTAAGLLKHELNALGSMILAAAKAARVPAGGALAVDREVFGRLITEQIANHPLIELERLEAGDLPPTPCVLATGPLTSEGFESVLTHLLGPSRLSFYDAAAPIVDADSIDMSVVFPASRYGKGDGADYLNCPMTRDEYAAFMSELTTAQRVIAKEFERSDLFQACQPVEQIARTGHDALRYGALKPVGLTDPRTGESPYAVVQLRAENAAATAYNLVGFQTNLTFAEQRRVFALIPGLNSAEFLRYGVMHRNTYVDAPRVLTPTLEVRDCAGVWICGQLSGTEGYLEAAASGLVTGLNVWASLNSVADVVLPPVTAIGSLLEYATHPETVDYQPMHVNFGLVPPLEPRVRGKRLRYEGYSTRARLALNEWIALRPDLCLGETVLQ